MAHEAPTTKEDAIITLLTHCTELELQTVFEQLQIHCMKNNCLHIIEKSFGIDQDEITDLIHQLEDSEEALESMTKAQNDGKAPPYKIDLPVALRGILPSELQNRIKQEWLIRFNLNADKPTISI